MFATVTVPGGGLAHLTVYLMDGDRELSTAISLANAVLSLGQFSLHACTSSCRDFLHSSLNKAKRHYNNSVMARNIQ